MIAKTAELAEKQGSKVYALVSGDAQGYIDHGADKVLVAELGEFSVESRRGALLEAVKASDAGLVLIGASKRGKEIAASGSPNEYEMFGVRE